jgi:hypothetical protein
MASKITGYNFIQGKTLPSGYEIPGGSPKMNNNELANLCNKNRNCLGFTTSTGVLQSSPMLPKPCSEGEVIGCHIAHPVQLANQGFYEKLSSNKFYLWEENKLTILGAIVAIVIITICIFIAFKLGSRAGSYDSNYGYGYGY